MSSNEACVLKIPKFKHDTFGMCVFATCGLLVQNSLSKELWSSDEIIFLAYSTNSFLCQIYKCAFAPYLTYWGMATQFDDIDLRQHLLR